ncbi:structural maintenance of chromosomes protein 2-like isoform X3 [Linepithema humile]|uniref:structural maintenance of chromosomes protein 2-like isoform X3 n=1 Tax=Linepithema humile TaxID=83485 RepID=UPI00351DEB06
MAPCKHFQLITLKIKPSYFRFLIHYLTNLTTTKMLFCFHSFMVTVNFRHLSLYESRMSAKYCIVDFIEENAVEVVPEFWICDEYCSWPPRDTIFPTKYVKNRAVPNDNWPTFKCRILSTFDEYKTARRNLGKAEITSDFASEAEVVSKRIHKPNKKYTSSSDSSEDNDRFKKSSVRISKSNKKRSKKECISKSIEVSSNSTDSEANETSHLMAKDVGSSQLQVPNSLHQKSKKILQKVSHSYSTKSTAGLSQRSLHDHSGDNKSTKATSREITCGSQRTSKDAPVGEIKKLADEITERFQQVQNSEKKKQYIGISEFEKHVRDLTMIKFDLRTIVDMISQLTQNLSTDAPKEIIHPIKEKDEQPEDNVLPAFPLKNWEQFCEMENLLHTNTVASRQLRL